MIPGALGNAFQVQKFMCALTVYQPMLFMLHRVHELDLLDHDNARDIVVMHSLNCLTLYLMVTSIKDL